METLYVTDNGLQLKRRSDRILFKKDGKITEEIPLLDMKRILIFGNNQISTDLMRHLAGKGVEVAFLSSRGKFKFRIVPETSKNIYLRMGQHRQYNNEEFRISWGKTIVRAKLTNQRNFLIRYQRNQPQTDIQNEIETLKKSVQNLEESSGLNEIMGTEGFGSKTYFNAYGKLLLNGFEMRKREYYPPPDPVNALLSFGYMILFNEINSLLEAHGFDVFLGFLHSAKYGRASLATDLIEELRSPVIDRLVIYLINQGAVKTDQFEKLETGAIRMNDRLKATYLKNYEKFMTTPFLDVKSRENVDYRQIIRNNVRQTEKVVLQGAVYDPYILYS
jgi:CRISPR-associated protein Cas1